MKRHELAEDALPFVPGVFGTDSEGADLVVAEAADPIVVRPSHQDIDEVSDAKTLPGAIGARERFLRRDRAVKGDGRHIAGVAIPAGRAGIAEVFQNDLAPA